MLPQLITHGVQRSKLVCSTRFIQVALNSCRTASLQLCIWMVACWVTILSCRQSQTVQEMHKLKICRVFTTYKSFLGMWNCQYHEYYLCPATPRLLASSRGSREAANGNDFHALTRLQNACLRHSYYELFDFQTKQWQLSDKWRIRSKCPTCWPRTDGPDNPTQLKPAPRTRELTRRSTSRQKALLNVSSQLDLRPWLEFSSASQ